MLSGFSDAYESCLYAFAITAKELLRELFVDSIFLLSYTVTEGFRHAEAGGGSFFKFHTLC